MVIIEKIIIDIDFSLIRCKRINYLINMEIIEDAIVIKYKCIISIYYFLSFISSKILHSCNARA